MKKIKRICFSILIISSSLTAQTFSAEDVFNLEKVASLLNGSNFQKENIAIALKRRNDSVQKANEVKTQKENSLYYETLKENLSKEQLEVLYNALMDTSKLTVLKENYSKRFDALELPSSFDTIIEAQLNEFARLQVMVDVEYMFSPVNKKQNKSTLKQQRKKYYLNISKSFDEAKKITNSLLTKCEGFKANEIKLLEAYYLFLRVDDQSESYQNEFALLTNESAFDSIAVKLAACKSVKYINHHRMLKKKDSIIQNTASIYFKKILLTQYKDQIQSLQDLRKVELNVEDNYISDLIKQSKAVKSSNSKDAQKKEFFGKVIKVGLDSIRANQLIILLSKKEEELNSIKKSKKNNTSFETINVRSSKKPVEIKKEYAKRIAELLTVGEYSKIFGESIKATAKENTDKDYSNILKLYELSDAQKLELHKIIFTYHLNHGVFNQYYSYDKKKLKQKNALLRYKFEKQYLSLMKDFGIEIAAKPELNNNTFQW